MSLYQHWIDKIESHNFRNEHERLNDCMSWEFLKSNALHTEQLLLQHAERSMNPPAVLLTVNPFRDYRELFLKANAARRMYRFTAYVLGFICITLVALALCMVATNVLVGGLVW